MDVDFAKLELYDNESVIKYYDNYINNYYSSNIYLLATATDSQTMIDLYNKYPNIIKGFGEIKCYSYFNNSITNKREKLDFGNLKWIYPLCEFNKDLKLPIYIHWINNSDERINELIQCLEKYPTIPFVLCHCGMSKNIQYK